MATAAMIAMIVTTIISSTSVRPRWSRFRERRHHLTPRDSGPAACPSSDSWSPIVSSPDHLDVLREVFEQSLCQVDSPNRPGYVIPRTPMASDVSVLFRASAPSQVWRITSDLTKPGIQTDNSWSVGSRGSHDQPWPRLARQPTPPSEGLWNFSLMSERSLLAVLLGTGGLHQVREGGGVADGQFGQDLPVQTDARFFEPAHEARVRQPEGPAGGVDPEDP